MMRPLLLLILDGWGHRENKEANAIAAANKPHWDKLWEHYPHTLLSGSGCSVGLPEGQMGNSEVGHLTIGAGRVIHQDLTRIDLAITQKKFFQNLILVNAVENTKKAGKTLHILGLLSPGGVHSHEKQIQAIVDLATQHQLHSVYVHAFLDGRDTPPQSAHHSLESLKKHGKIASFIGRYYAMDRDQRWDRTQIAYELLTEGTADIHSDNATLALQEAYARGDRDEFIKASAIHDLTESPVTIQDGDTVIFMNFRADRARQLTRAFVDKNFQGFQRRVWPRTHFVTLTEYDSTFQIPVAYPPESLHDTLPDYLSQLHLNQLRIAETEKYAHVTFFFNGGREEPYAGEDRILIPSPRVSTYDLQPEMSVLEVTDRLVDAIKTKKYDVIICNLANPDMLGHTGNFAATVKAIETIDTCIGKIIDALKRVGGESIITADHGNAEMMFDKTTQQPHTAHTCELVPFLYVGRKATIVKSNGSLSDIAPTMLHIMGLNKPEVMTGETLLHLQ